MGLNIFRIFVFGSIAVLVILLATNPRLGGRSINSPIRVLVGNREITTQLKFTERAMDDSGKRVGVIRLEAMLPDMVAKADMDPPGRWGFHDKDEVVVLITDVGVIWNNRLDVRHVQKNIKDAKFDAKLGLYVLSSSVSPPMSLFFSFDKSGDIDWFAECLVPGRAKVDLCLSVMREYQDIGVTYSFEFGKLQEWQRLRAVVGAFVSETVH
ncbi:MAG: hypothetical protein ACOH12_07705 [Parvibaculaceae bacterium]